MEQHGCEGATPRFSWGGTASVCRYVYPPLSSLSSHSHHTMTSSHGTNISTQPSQLLRGTSQPSLTRFYRNPNLEDTIPSQLAWAWRPHSIEELAKRAQQSLGGGTGSIIPFKSWLRIAEKARQDAESFQGLGDFESAFVEYAKAATIVHEKIPGHPDYMVLLTTTQRHNMSLVSYLIDFIAGSYWLVTCLSGVNALTNAFLCSSCFHLI